ncbi:EAL domain-containing protein [[Clostridium] polysaccharolyticum]|uniref:EAL domain, c-di-GMP-specific phosphodiesterase class I (Or its enzymatically inactive variant) n=1 Tax=[Clostridium] polysaccharolyticum TaxID=29364 RepID=A0A1H9Y4C1_9FIRM|nr:EAL domain-containing protein [[Clostridium] polysaccharolyticum]SES63528.1 EAL domain, c-di-GMP-specific phosphodiesterase class I (or its enzymatically inactive variant) [[Clostridium] polysaccharolyticum]
MLSNTIEFSIASFIFTFLLTISFYMKQKYHNRKNHLICVMLVLSLALSVIETSFFLVPKEQHISIPYLCLVRFAYLLLHAGIYIIFFIFLCETGKSDPKKACSNFVLVLSAITAVLFTLLTLFTHAIFYYDSTGIYHNGPFFFAWYGLYVLLSFSILAVVLRNFKQFSNFIRISGFYLFATTAIGGIIQYNSPDIILNSLLLTIFAFTIFNSLSNDDIYFDKYLGCLNNKAFIEKAAACFSAKKNFTIVAFTIREYTYVEQVLGQAAIDELNKRLISFLYQTFDKDNIYALYNVGYAMFVDSKQEEISAAIKLIQDHFQEPFSLNGRLERLSSIFCLAENPYFAKNGQQLIDEINNTLLDMNKNQSHQVSYATGKYLAIVQREQQVIYAMKKAIEKNSFEMYYQPIYDLNRHCIKSLEALLRLNDEELGFIPPDEFIQIAEKNGMIIDVSSIAFRKVCAFIHDNDIKSLGVDYIEYNLSSVECDNPMLATDLLDVMHEYSVSPSQLNFEITETAQAHNVKELIRNMERLIEAGSTFSMDDYGTGYSTTHYLIKLPLHIVKIDKSILWPAMKDDKSYNVLRQLIATIKSIDKKIVVEGVETKEMVDTLDNLNCDYLQGYYYSKPIPSEEIIQFLNHANKIMP